MRTGYNENKTELTNSLKTNKKGLLVLFSRTNSLVSLIIEKNQVRIKVNTIISTSPVSRNL